MNFDIWVSIFENPDNLTTQKQPERSKASEEEILSTKRINRNTASFEKYMKNGSDLSYPRFIEEVEAMSGRLGMDPNVLLTVFAFESGIDHSRKNPTSSAAGLIQLMDYTAKEYGVTTEELRKMNPIEQLKYVERYYSRWAKISRKDNLYSNPVNVYAAVAAPGFLRYSDEKVIYKKGSSSANANPGWDVNQDGQIQKGELLQTLKSNKASKGFLPKNRNVIMKAPKLKP